MQYHRADTRATCAGTPEGAIVEAGLNGPLNAHASIEGLRPYRTASCGVSGQLRCVRESLPPDTPKPKLLDRVRAALRIRHYSRRTEEVYVSWIRRYILFHDKRHPVEMGAPEVTTFLTTLAVEGKVAASTQNQALSALLFLYREVLGIDLPWLDGIVRAKLMTDRSVADGDRHPRQRAQETGNT